MSDQPFTILGQTVREPTKKLETFPTPRGIENVKLVSEEFTSLCPITGAPDFQTITIEYLPTQLCLESKSLKLYLWSFRERGAFCEALAAEIAEDLFNVLTPIQVTVVVSQKPRGGIAIEASATFPPF